MATNSRVDDVLPKLKNVKKIGSGWSARCPAHDDHSNSLSVSRGAGGKLLMHCHTGCTFEQITVAIGEGPKVESAAYRYTDEEGKLLFEVVRKEPKGFSQRRPGPNGEWVWKLGDTRRVLYHLPEVLAAGEFDVVYVCEGEKDADRLMSLGAIATTNSGGAGKWRPEYSRALADKMVCILPDNDEPGEAHARTVAGSLVGKAASVKVLRLPGLGDKEDVSDWLNRGGDLQQLDRLWSGAEEFRFAEEPVLESARIEPARQQQVPDEPFPHNPDVERAVLGSVLLEPGLFPQVRRGTASDSYHLPMHREAFMAMVELDDDERPIDEVTLADCLRRRGRLEQLGGMEAVRDLSRGLSRTNDLGQYLDILGHYQKARAGMRFAAKLRAELAAMESAPELVLGRASEWLDTQRQQSKPRRRPTSLDEMYEDYALRLELFFKGVSNAIPTGFPQIDRHLLGGGLIPSGLYVFAGRPSMGKTTFALDVAANAADAGFRSYVVTKEMLKESLMDRMVSAKSGVLRFKIAPGMSQREYEAALETAQALRYVPMVLDDTSHTVYDIDAELRDLESQGQKVDLLVVDYLQLMGGNKDNGRTQEVSEISSGLKGLAMKWEIPVIAVSQLTRAPGRENREPELYDLRESGQIEQDADVVLFLHGDMSEEGVVFMEKVILCKKQREGALFHEPMDMNAGLVTFRPLHQLKKGSWHEEKLVQPQATPQAAEEEEGTLGF